MLTIQYAGSGKHIARLQKFLTDSRVDAKLGMEQIAKTIVQANKMDRDLGLQPDGKPMPPLRTERLGVYKGKKGPPLAPYNRERGKMSKSISLFTIDMYEIPNGYELIAGWRDGPMRTGGKYSALEILKFHANGIAGAGRPIIQDGKVVGWRGVKGRVSNIKRDIFGLSPQSWRLVRKAIRTALGGRRKR